MSDMIQSTFQALFSSSPDTMDDYPPEMRGFRALWRAIILQALEDAASNSKKSKEQYFKTQAIHWLNHGGQDFVEVCDYAGLDPDYARKQIKKALSRGCKWRAEAGLGKDAERRKLRRKKTILPKASTQTATPMQTLNYHR